MSKNCISSRPGPSWPQTLAALGQPAFRAGQIYRWLHQKQVTEFSAMTDQPKALLKTWRSSIISPRPPSAAASSPRTVPSSTCSPWRTATASRRWSCGTNTAIPSVCPPRWAAGWAAGSAPPPRPAGAQPGGRRDRGPTLHRPAGISGSVSPISCSWASANRWTISIT